MRWKILAGVSAVAAAVALTAVAVPQVGADPAGTTISVLGQPDTGSNTLASRCAGPNAQFNQNDFGGGGFATDGPAGMVLSPTGRLFVLDDGGQRVLSWPNADALSACQAADKVIGAGELEGPEGITLGPDGTLYVADTLAHAIDIFQPDGAGNYPAVPSVQLGTPNNPGSAGNLFQYPRGLALDSAGRLLVDDDYNARIQIFYPPFTTGQFANDSIGAANDGGFGHPKDIELVDNQLFVADFDHNRVLRFTGPFDNPATTYTSSATFTGVTNPVNLTVGPDKTLYVTGAGDHPAVDSFSAATTSAGATAPGAVYTFGGLFTPGPDNAAGEPLDVVATAGGRLLVADYAGYRVLIENPAPVNGLTVDNPDAPNGRAYVAYKYKFTASGGKGGLKWSVTGGALPPGLKLSAGGVISGHPTAIGGYDFTVSVHDSSKPAKTGSVGVEIGVQGMLIDFTSKKPAVAFTKFTGKFVNDGGKKPVTYAVVAGQLPPGLTLKSNGVLSGTPTESADFQFTVRGTDHAQPADTAELPVSLVVEP